MVTLALCALTAWVTLGIVRVATVRRDRTVFVGPSVLWAIPASWAVLLSLLAGAAYYGHRTAIQTARAEAAAVASVEIGDAAEQLRAGQRLTDSLQAHRLSCPLDGMAPGC